MKSIVENKTQVEISKMGFGFFDKKNREIGMQVSVFECDFVAAEQDARTWTNIEPGHYFVAITVSTRDSEPFCAGRSAWQYFATREERDVYLAKCWADSLESASKKSN